MRFIDANVFIYTILKPKRELNEKELKIKRVSKEIFNRINEGEEVITTVAHLSELQTYWRMLRIPALQSLS